MKQFDITVKIRVSVPEGDDSEREALWIGNYYAEMAMKYKSVGADQILEVKAEETK